MSDTEKDKDVPMVDSHEATEEPPTTSTNTPSFPHLAQEQAKEESATLGAEVAHKKINYEQEAQKLEEKALRFLAKQTHPVIIPSFASWFDISKIHEIEKRSNPDFSTIHQGSRHQRHIRTQEILSSTRTVFRRTNI